MACTRCWAALLPRQRRRAGLLPVCWRAPLRTTAGPVLWCSVHTGGDLYAPGLASYGIAPDRVLVVRPKDTEETFWAMEEGLRSGAVAAVLGHLGDGARPPSHTAFRRFAVGGRTRRCAGGVAADGRPCARSRTGGDALACACRAKCAYGTGCHVAR